MTEKKLTPFEIFQLEAEATLQNFLRRRKAVQKPKKKP
jgi:hypothetical protein